LRQFYIANNGSWWKQLNDLGGHNKITAYIKRTVKRVLSHLNKSVHDPIWHKVHNALPVASCIVLGFLMITTVWRGLSSDVALDMYVDGKMIGVVSDVSGSVGAIAALEADISEKVGVAYKFDYEIEYKFTTARRRDVLTASECYSILQQYAMNEVTTAHALYVDGVIVAANQDEEAIAGVLLSIERDMFEKTSTDDKVDAIYIANQVEIKEQYCLNQYIASAQDIALETDDLDFAVVKTETEVTQIPYDTVYVKTECYYEDVEFCAVAGSCGEQISTYTVEYVNGREISRVLNDEYEVLTPTAEVIYQGTAPYPKTVVTGRFVWPTVSRHVTSPYGPRGNSHHMGIDIDGNRGTPIYAADGGVVVFAGPEGTYGQSVIIKHDDVYSTRYAHQSKILVKEGDRVYQGQVIGMIGDTGRAFGCHLHFEILKDGKDTSPMPYFAGK